jgi:hypothetical protein
MREGRRKRKRKRNKYLQAVSNNFFREIVQRDASTGGINFLVKFLK